MPPPVLNCKGISMLATQNIAKASDRQIASALLDRQAREIRHAFNIYVAQATSDHTVARVAPFIARGEIGNTLTALDGLISNFVNAFAFAFLDAGKASAARLSGKLTFKAEEPTVVIVFNVSDPEAVRLMERNRLNLVSNFTRLQRDATRQALVAGMREGLGISAMAGRFRDSIGLTPNQLAAVESYRRALQAGSSNALDRELRDRRFDGSVSRAIDADDALDILTPDKIERMVSRYSQNMVRMRAETIARSESTRITGQAQDAALRQSLKATGQVEAPTGKVWNATHDARTRDHHAERDGERRRLNDEFAPGVMKPGDGGPREGINCRCVLTFEFFEDEASLQAWLRAG